MCADWIHNVTSDNNSATNGKHQDDEKGNGVEHESGIKVDLTQAGEHRRSRVPARFPACGSQLWSIVVVGSLEFYVKEWGAEQSE